MRANGGKERLRRIIYAMVDAQYADKVVAVTDCLVPFPNIPASISMVDVDYVCVVDEIGIRQRLRQVLQNRQRMSERS